MPVSKNGHSAELGGTGTSVEDKPEIFLPEASEGPKEQGTPRIVPANTSTKAFGPRKGSVRTAPSRWQGSLLRDGSWQLNDGHANSINVRMDRLTGTTGSLAEAGEMLRLGTARGWNPMAFSGNPEFKANVMRAALARGLQVQAYDKADIALYEKVKTDFEKERSLKNAQDRKEHEQPLTGGRTSQSDDRHSEIVGASRQSQEEQNRNPARDNKRVVDRQAEQKVALQKTIGSKQ
jgi:hypothetical protein